MVIYSLGRIDRFIILSIVRRMLNAIQKMTHHQTTFSFFSSKRRNHYEHPKEHPNWFYDSKAFGRILFSL
ncbi:hypothetical protein BGP_3219 [Beggiatoa sp. PS]|nr:hypothetical protein BGP_3219 [Beggiatoa sp. PS]